MGKATCQVMVATEGKTRQSQVVVLTGRRETLKNNRGV